MNTYKCVEISFDDGAVRGLAVLRTGSSMCREIPVNVVKHMCALFVSKCS